MASNKLAVSCILEIPNETASDANPLMSARILWAPSIDSIGALTSLKKASNGSVIKPRLGISLMYLFASLANKGIKIRKNNRIKVIAIMNVITMLILFGTPILDRYTWRGLNRNAKTMLVNIGDARSPKTHNEKKPKARTDAKNINCWFLSRLFNLIIFWILLKKPYQIIIVNSYE